MAMNDPKFNWFLSLWFCSWHNSFMQLPDENHTDKHLGGEDKALIRNAIYRLLARREHSEYELVQKLSAKGFAPAVVKTIAEEFTLQNLQSDFRYAESVLRGALSKGHGPQRVSQQLKQNHIAEEVIAEVLTAVETDWYALAFEVKTRKFGDLVESDWHKNRKQQRFLLGRGFTFEQINYAVTHIPESDA